MTKQFAEPNQSILVALKFDEHASTLIQWGVALAQRTGMALELMHVTEHHPGYFAPYSIGALEDFVVAFEGEILRSAQSKLRDLAEKHAGKLKPKVHVISDYAPQAIMEQGIRSNAGVILVGAATGSHRFVPKGFSTALTLLSESSVPVLVIPFGTKTTLTNERNNIIFADDLSSRTEPVVSTGIAFASALGAADFYHVHVNPLTSDVLEASIASASASGHIQQAGLSIKELQTQIAKVLEQKLNARAIRAQALLEASNGKYIPILKDGEAQSELDDLVGKLHPAIIIFGRHKTFHHRPFMIGHVPFHAMMEFNVPMMVIPEERY